MRSAESPRPHVGQQLLVLRLDPAMSRSEWRRLPPAQVLDQGGQMSASTAADAQHGGTIGQAPVRDHEQDPVAARRELERCRVVRDAARSGHVARWSERVSWDQTRFTGSGHSHSGRTVRQQSHRRAFRRAARPGQDGRLSRTVRLDGHRPMPPLLLAFETSRRQGSATMSIKAISTSIWRTSSHVCASPRAGCRGSCAGA